MDRTFLFIVSFAVVSTILIAIVKQTNIEFGFLLVIASGVVILFLIIELLAPVLYFVQTLSDTISFSNFDIVLKVVGVAFIADIAEGICNDCGQTANAKKVSIAARLTIIVIAIPLFDSIIVFVKGLVE